MFEKARYCRVLAVRLVYKACARDSTFETAPALLPTRPQVMLPASLSGGDYVLGFRWDCEESNQIWQSCSDVTITA